MKVAVAGATGFVGTRLCAALVAAGHPVRAMTRHSKDYRGPGLAVQGDVGEPSSLLGALIGAEAAYYLVHSLDSPDFVALDRQGAAAFGDAAAASGLRQVICLGGMGSEIGGLSAHLASRREVEGILTSRSHDRAAPGIVVGDGGISWEILRQLVTRLPVMITPRWVQTRTQPVTLDDVVAFLVSVLGTQEAYGQVHDIGDTDVLTYAEMLNQLSAAPMASSR